MFLNTLFLITHHTLIFFMVILLLFIFFVQSTLIAAEAAPIEPPTALDTLGTRNRAALEHIGAIIDGRIRFNKVILKMLENEQIPAEDRISEFYIAQGLSEREIRAKIEPAIKEQSLELAKKDTKADIQRLTTTKSVYKLVESGEMEPIKSAAFLAVNIYSTIISLEIQLSDLSREQIQHSTRNDYSEFPYYKEMAIHLRATDLLDSYQLIEDMFIRVKKQVGFNCKISWDQVQFLLININEKLIKLQSLKKIQNNELAAEIRSELKMHNIKFNEIKCNLEQQMKEQQTTKYYDFSSLNNAFKKNFWPCIKAKLAIQTLLKDLQESEQKLKTLKKLPKSKTLSTKKQESADEEPEEDEASNEEQPTDSISLVNIGRLTSTALQPSSLSSHPTTSTAAIDLSSSSQIPEWMKELKGESKKVDFWDMLKEFQKSLGAKINHAQMTEITLRGPNQQLTKIFCHTPHGAQLKKSWPGWRHNMIDGLQAAGFAL